MNSNPYQEITDRIGEVRRKISKICSWGAVGAIAFLGLVTVYTSVCGNALSKKLAESNRPTCAVKYLQPTNYCSTTNFYENFSQTNETQRTKPSKLLIL
jgi:hypothetical protein